MLLFSDFTDMIVQSGGTPCNKHLTATKDNKTWHLALRHGLYSAQKDIAVNSILRHFMPTTPELFLVEHEGYYYVASAELSNLDKTLCSSAKQAENAGYISVLMHFLGESDIHSGQLLFQNTDSGMTVYKIDNAESLDDEELKKPVSEEVIFGNHWRFSEQLIESVQFKQEQNKMLNHISELDFSFFRNIISKTVTASHKEESETHCHNILKMLVELKSKPGVTADDQQQIEEQIEAIKSGLVKLAADKAPVPEIEAILSLLESRHQHYRQVANLKSMLEAPLLLTPHYAAKCQLPAASSVLPPLENQVLFPSLRGTKH